MTQIVKLTEKSRRTFADYAMRHSRLMQLHTLSSPIISTNIYPQWSCNQWTQEFEYCSSHSNIVENNLG